MKSLTATDTLKLWISERIQPVEDIWDTIASNAESVELTTEEKEIINVRLDAFHNNPNSGSPWKDVFNRITNSKSLE